MTLSSTISVALFAGTLWGLPSVLAASPSSAVGAARVPRAPDSVFLIIRTDDAGMSHSVNMALERLIDTGLPITVSMLFACPCYQEMVEFLKRHPETYIAIHLL